MGAGFFFPSNRRHDRIEIFDYTSLLIDGRLLKSVQAPACLEELVDWTKSANLMIRDMPDMIQLKFRPYIKTSYCNDEPGNELSSVVIVGEGAEAGTLPDSTLKKSVISVPDFCIYYMLLRRYSEIMDIGRPSFLLNGLSSPECGICMSQADEVVLPCAHSMCSTCAMKWVEVHAHCPFCRYHYDDLKRLERDKWQDSLEHDICNLESRLKSFWYKRSSFSLITPDEWIPLSPSATVTSLNVTNDFVLIQ